MIKVTAKFFFTNRNILILIIATMGMLPELISFGGYYPGGDITHQMLPFVYETKRMFLSGVPFWSWNTYFGDNFIASYAYYTVFNPFTWINSLFPYRYLGVGFTLVLYLKFLICGYVAQKYLKKIGFDERLSLIGCLLYTFSSWAISNLIFYMFLEPMILFPFLLIFVERFLRKDKHGYSGLALATFLVVVVNYYFAAINIIAAAIYFFCRLPSIKKTSCKVAWFSHAALCEMSWVALKAWGCVAIGIISASVVLIPVLIQLNGSPHESTNFDFSDIYMIADRIFWLFYPKAHEGRFYYVLLNPGWKSNTASIAVFGMLPTIMLFTKKGFVWVKWFTGILIIIYITPLNGLFSLFTDCYYTRWAYALTLAIIISTLYYIRDNGLPPMKYAVLYCLLVYGVYFLFCGASAVWRYRINLSIVSSGIVSLMMDAVLVIINVVALLLLCRRGLMESRRFNAIVFAVIGCTALQFFFFSLPGIGNLPSGDFIMTETEYFHQDGDFREEGDFLYRTNFTVINTGGRPSSNFGIITNRPSIETYHSLQNNKIQKWIEIVGSPDPKRVFYPQNYVKSFEALMSVKDLVMVSNTPVDTVLSIGTGDKDGIFSVYESDHYIPMGFAYDQYVMSEDIEDIAQSDKQIDIPKVLLSALAIDNEDEKVLSCYLKKGWIDGTLSFDSIVDVRRTVTCDSFTGHSQGFDAHIELDSARVVFFSVLADPGFSAFIDGKPTKIYETNLGFSSVIVPAGSHYITFRYFTPGLKLGLILMTIGLSAIGFMLYVRL